MASSAFTRYIEFEVLSGDSPEDGIPRDGSSRESLSRDGPLLQGPGIPTAPERAVPRIYHSVPQGPPNTIELDNLEWGVRLTGPEDLEVATSSRAGNLKLPGELEMSRPATPLEETEGVFAMQSLTNPPVNRFRMLTVSLTNFNMGMSDSAPGALIPYIEKHYEIGYAVVSLIFVTNALGFIAAAFLVDAIRARLGRARTKMLANAVCALGFLPLVCTPPFPVVVCSFTLLGWGMGTNLALGNVFAGNLQNATHMLGLMHGSYGVGGVFGPLIATTMVTSGGLIWSRFYILTLCMSVFNAAFSGWAFWNYEKDFLPTSQPLNQPGPNDASRPPVLQSSVKPPSLFSSMFKALKNKIVLLGALFIFAYQGAEVSISGWVISFLITTRHGNPASVGYVTAGFWGGITVGRFLLSRPAQKIGEKVFVYGLVLGAAAFQLLVWFVPNVIGDAVGVAIVGLLLGPVYPCAASMFTHNIPRASQVSALGVISAFGSSGGAIAPFTTGILAQAVGTFVLHPIAIALFVVMLGSWYGIPNVRKRRE